MEKNTEEKKPEQKISDAKMASYNALKHYIETADLSEYIERAKKKVIDTLFVKVNEVTVENLTSDNLKAIEEINIDIVEEIAREIVKGIATELYSNFVQRGELPATVVKE